MLCVILILQLKLKYLKKLNGKGIKLINFLLPLLQVQIRPWRLSDADFVLDASMPLDPRKTVFVGGVPRPLKAGKL